MDQLSTDGVCFTNAHSLSSVCTPTRYGVVTGRYCWHTHLKHEVLYRYEPTTDQARPFNRCQIAEKLDIKRPVPVNGVLVWNSQLKR